MRTVHPPRIPVQALSVRRHIITRELPQHTLWIVWTYSGVCRLSRFTNCSKNCNLIRVSGENHGDSSDGLWTIYLTEAEKQDTEVTESWKGDTEGILVFVSHGPAPLAHVDR